MAELRLSNILIISVIFFLQLELFFSNCYYNIIFFTKYLNNAKTFKVNTTLTKVSINLFFFFFLVIVFSKVKSDINLTLFVTSIIFFWLLSKFLNIFTLFSKLNTNFYSIIIFLLMTFVYLLNLVNSFLSLFFFIELYGVLYYFSFLTSYSISTQTLLKYKNSLLLLLWNNFLTTFFLAFSCYLLISASGTTDFVELIFIEKSSYCIYIFLLGLSWKIGIPVFHFFKLEIYKYLLRENIFLFSISTTIINLILLYFLISQPVVLDIIYNQNFIIIPIIFVINLLLSNLKLFNILHYFALSSILTMTTILTLFLFKKC